MRSPADRALGLFVTVHDAVYQRTGGRLGHRIPGAPPMLLLHTVGAKTGRPRTHSLAYFRDGADYLVVASNGGAPRNPAWFHNATAGGRVEVNVGTERFGVTATPVLSGDPDYPRLWTLCDQKNAGRYSAYQTLTNRRIPIIRLSPRPTPPR